MKSFNTNKKGSALIMAVAVVSLLGIIGAVFLLVSRLESQTTSSISDYKSLDSAVDSVIAKLSSELKKDVPGVNGQEYYDYPGDDDKWLANLEPYDKDITAGTDYVWGQISDLYGNMAVGECQDFGMDIVLENDTAYAGSNADADGDGVADAKWVKLRDVSTSKGQSIYAAIRVIDNSAMINVNTAYKFDPTSTTQREIDGTRQTQINFLALAERDNTHTDTDEKQERFLAAVTGTEPNDIDGYFDYAVKKFTPIGNFTQFDISDELMLRYRYFLADDKFDTRIEDLWTNCFETGKEVPVDEVAINSDSTIWFDRASSYTADPCLYDYRHIATTYNVDMVIDPNGDKMLQIWEPNNALAVYEKIQGLARDDDQRKQFAQFAANLIDYCDDYYDVNVAVLDTSTTTVDVGKFYGWEKPDIYISEIATKYTSITDSTDGAEHRSFAFELFKPFGREEFNDWYLDVNGDLYNLDKSSFYDTGGNYYVVVFQDAEAALDVNFIDSPEDGAENVDIDAVLNWDSISGATYQLYFEGIDGATATVDLKEELKEKIADANSSNFTPIPLVDSEYENPSSFGIFDIYYWKIIAVDALGEQIFESDVWKLTTADGDGHPDPNNSSTLNLTDGTILNLYRKIAGESDFLIDTVTVPAGFNDITGSNSKSYKRDIHWKALLKSLWTTDNDPTLGHSNGYAGTDAINPAIQPLHHDLFTVGEIGHILIKSPYDDARIVSSILNADFDKNVRLDLADPIVQKFFQYLTMKDPSRYNLNEDYRIKGRININTAPWYVLAQLPWVSARNKGYADYSFAKAIVDYRDLKGDYSGGRYNAVNSNISYLASDSGEFNEDDGFETIGELNHVIADTDRNGSIFYYALDSTDQIGFPDLTFGSISRRDGMSDDFEERNLIFSRISDLVTVRSDVFTAYILVRIGENGPQKRVIAILDRSMVQSDNEKVDVRVKYPVPDAR